MLHVFSYSLYRLKNAEQIWWLESIWCRLFRRNPGADAVVGIRGNFRFFFQTSTLNFLFVIRLSKWSCGMFLGELQNHSAIYTNIREILIKIYSPVGPLPDESHNWTNCTFGLHPSSGVSKNWGIKYIYQKITIHTSKIHTRVNYKITKNRACIGNEFWNIKVIGSNVLTKYKETDAPLLKNTKQRRSEDDIWWDI
jgi:hypothetical protein